MSPLNLRVRGRLHGSFVILLLVCAALASFAVRQLWRINAQVASLTLLSKNATLQVSSHIIDVQRGASETGSASSQVLSSTQSLSGDGSRLKLEVGKLLKSARAA